MRKLIGLCFLSATLVATSARAQGIYIDRGDPSAISATVGGGIIKDGWGGGAMGGWTYRGVFDVGADLSYYKYTGGSNKNLSGISLTPFVTFHAIKAEEDELPISISATLGVQRQFYTGNSPVANPEGWGLYVGPSLYRRIEMGGSMLFVPEVLVAYDLKATRYYSGALDQSSGNLRDASGGAGYATDMKHGVRALLRPNLLVKAGNTKYLVMPYAGYQSGFVVGGNVGAMF
ncbi:MAG: hypothetical protein JXP73_09125 [Deltaproteobacteria bacterium]|nr:hypothetical protein [Deltaproteobacteria bacterium]